MSGPASHADHPDLRPLRTAPSRPDSRAERRLHARAATGVVTFCDQRTGSGMRGAVGMADVRDVVPGAQLTGINAQAGPRQGPGIVA